MNFEMKMTKKWNGLIFNKNRMEWSKTQKYRNNLKWNDNDFGMKTIRMIWTDFE